MPPNIVICVLLVIAAIIIILICWLYCHWSEYMKQIIRSSLRAGQPTPTRTARNKVITGNHNNRGPRVAMTTERPVDFGERLITHSKSGRSRGRSSRSSYAGSQQKQQKQQRRWGGGNWDSQNDNDKYYDDNNIDINNDNSNDNDNDNDNTAFQPNDAAGEWGTGDDTTTTQPQPNQETTTQQVGGAWAPQIGATGVDINDNNDDNNDNSGGQWMANGSSRDGSNRNGSNGGFVVNEGAQQPATGW